MLICGVRLPTNTTKIKPSQIPMIQQYMFLFNVFGWIEPKWEMAIEV